MKPFPFMERKEWAINEGPYCFLLRLSYATRVITAESSNKWDSAWYVCIMPGRKDSWWTTWAEAYGERKKKDIFERTFKSPHGRGKDQYLSLVWGNPKASCNWNRLIGRGVDYYLKADPQIIIPINPLDDTRGPSNVHFKNYISNAVEVLQAPGPEEPL